MSESLVAEPQPDLSSLTGSPGQKRKREASSPSSQRAKRPAPPAAMNPNDTTSFIENAIQATEAHAANGLMNAADFTALQQATQEGNVELQDQASATSTAQAALGMYPTLHVPPSTEEQFAAQAAAEAAAAAAAEAEAAVDAQHHEPPPPFDHQEVPQHEDVMNEPPLPQDQQPPPNGVHGPHTPRYTPSVGTPNNKPTVGSEEWHKMRKDNHKEGKHRALLPSKFT